MALYPCDQGHHRYYGAQQTIYPAFVGGSQVYRRKLRLCPVHFHEFVEMLEVRAELATDGELTDISPTCILCGQSAPEASVMFFATVYNRANERSDYWAACHDQCAPAAREDWLQAQE